jgi:hypothetical protein
VVCASGVQVDELGRQLQARIQQVNELGRAAQSGNKELTDQLLRKQTETEEVVQAGNKKYNAMLAERMRTEDELRERIKVGGQPSMLSKLKGLMLFTCRRPYLCSYHIDSDIIGDSSLCLPNQP